MPAGFFSGPFEPEETARLLALVEGRLALRGDVVSDALPVALVELGRALATAPDATVAGVAVPAAPLFDVRRGGPVSRGAKRVANVALRVFGRPQQHFDRAVAQRLESAAATLHAMRCEDARTREAIERMDERLAQLERRLAARPRQPLEPPHGPRVRVGGGAADASGCVQVGSEPRPGVHVVADVARLPFRSGSLAEIAVRPATDRDAGPRDLAGNVAERWLALLQAGGIVRVACADDDAAAILVHAILERVGSADEPRPATFRTVAAADGVDLVVQRTS